MNVHTGLYDYLKRQWGQQTRLIIPNTHSGQYQGPYEDEKSTLRVTILDVGYKAMEFMTHQESTQVNYYLLLCHLTTPQNIGDGKALSYSEYLDALFHNQSISHSSFTYYFEGSRKRAPLIEQDLFTIPWECPFHVYSTGPHTTLNSKGSL